MKLSGFLLFSICILFHSCASSNTQDAPDMSGHLSTDLVESPRSLTDDSVALNNLGRLFFTDTIHDFGKVTEGEIVEVDFDFENRGKKDVIISEAKASCGCTVPSYPEQPLKSGAKDKIRVTFNSEGKKGYNEKMIIVHTNGNPATYNLFIRAEVEGK